MTYLTRREVDCAKEVAEQYDGIDVVVLLAEMENPRWWNVSAAWWPWSYHAAHAICARLEDR
jgi:hypothetical protein